LRAVQQDLLSGERFYLSQELSSSKLTC